MRKYTLLIFFIILNAQVWQSSFTAGSFDDNNSFMGGSEVLQLVSHKNKLFASISYWQDESNIWYGGSNPNIGWSQVILLNNLNDFNLSDIDQVKFLEKATSEGIFDESDLLNLYKKFQYEIDDLINYEDASS